jgi:predicted  nucleic acid-binding Zn-ribbon protein
MSGPAVIVRESHRLRRFIRDLQEQIDRAPRQQKIYQAKVVRQEELYRQEQDAIKRLKVDVHEKEVTFKTVHGHIAKYQGQLNAVGSKKEYDALQTEIAGGRAKCQQLEDEMLAALAESEERTARLPELDANVQKARTEAAEFERGAAERLAGLTAQRDEAHRRLAEVEASIPPDVRSVYNRVVNAKGADGMAAVQQRVCSACATEITAQNYNDLLLDNFVLCKSCGRILYLPERPTVSEE